MAYVDLEDSQNALTEALLTYMLDSMEKEEYAVLIEDAVNKTSVLRSSYDDPELSEEENEQEYKDDLLRALKPKFGGTLFTYFGNGGWPRVSYIDDASLRGIVERFFGTIVENVDWDYLAEMLIEKFGLPEEK